MFQVTGPNGGRNYSNIDLLAIANEWILLNSLLD